MTSLNTDNLSSLCYLFADDYILNRDIKSAEDVWILQEDLNKLAIWAKTWGMQFNIDKCQVAIKIELVTLMHDPCITEYFLQNRKL